MRIVLKDGIPVDQSARRLAFSENQDVNKQIDEWLEQGIVRPSSSEYASPILVKKKDGTTRLCMDYRKLNRKLVKDHFPLPLIEDVLDKLPEAKVYTTSCGEGHEANDKDCKKYQEEIEILKIKVQQQISRNEAIEKFQRDKKTSYSAKTYNDQTEKIENLEKKFAKLELKFEENNNIFEKKLEQIVQRFTAELNTAVAQINLRFSTLMNTMESTLKKVASNITIQKDDDYLINRKQNEKAKRLKKISEHRGNTLESTVEKNKGT
ncbi:transposon Tf2-9 polyprotein [Trichonephila clavipes]|nr:transposon Tf2-9 polyprotein [Trichonephila clavipes]